MKKIYRNIIKKIIDSTVFLHKTKMLIFEWLEIWRKRELYTDINFTNKQTAEIENLWMVNYGKKVSTKWHKLYQSINGEYNKLYFPEYIYTTKLEPKLNPIDIATFYSDKGLTELIYRNVDGVGFAQTIVLNSNDYFYDKNRKVISKEKAIEEIKKNQEFVIKPTIGGSSGKSVRLIDLKGLSEDNMTKVVNEVISEYNNNYIIQHKLLPNKKYQELYPHSINTIRLITYVINDEIYHTPISLRMGSGGKNVDNVHAGGIVIGVSDEGKLNKYGYQLGYGDSKTKYQYHPDTKVRFENYHIPGVSEMIRVSKRLHSHTPHLGIISWDLMLNNNNTIILVEGNYYGQSVWFPQIIHGKGIFGDNTEKMIQLIK